MRTGPKVCVSSGVIVNPVDQQVLIDSGVLPATGAWLLGITGQTDTSFRFKVVADSGLTLTERRPAAGDVDWLAPNHQPLPQNDRVKVICVGGVTATLHLTLHGVLAE